MTRTGYFRGALYFLSAVCVAALLPGAAGAGIVGSKHDFSESPAEVEACTACHLPHSAQDSDVLWGRNLTGAGQERGVFNENASPNYIQNMTILCYDCHDDNAAGGTTVDRDPDWTWVDGPQDIAFTDGPGGETGYYELIDGSLPSGNGPTDGSPTGGHYWKSNPSGRYAQGDKLACRLCHDPHDRYTAGNDAMFRTTTNDGNGGVVQIPLGSNRTSSVNTRAHEGGNPTIFNGRLMCASCHSFSDGQGSYGADGIPNTPVNMYSVDLPQPTTTIGAHDSSDDTPCTNCHKHNKITASCNECHGFPPLNDTVFDTQSNPNGYSSGYPNGAAVALAHKRHLDALGSLFDCAICHGPNAGSATWHDFGNGTVNQNQVDIMGQSQYWDAEGSRPDGTRRYTGIDGSETRPAGYEFVAKGDGAMQCFDFTCHGDPPATGTAVLNWDDRMVDSAGDAVEIEICKWCHDTTPARINGAMTYTYDTSRVYDATLYAPMVAGDGVNFGADVNGHGATGPFDLDAVGDTGGVNGPGFECDICHDATYPDPPAAGDPTETDNLAPTRTHFNTGTVVNPMDEKRLRDTINTETIGTSSNFPTGPDDACAACHRNGNSGDGAEISYHGIPPQPPPAGGYKPSEPADPEFTRACRQCHEVHGSNWNGTGRNLYMIGRWIDNGDRVPDAGDGAYVDSSAGDALTDITTADNAVQFTQKTGNNSFDESDTVGTQDGDDVCATCHAVPGGGGVGTGGGDHSGTDSFGGDMRGQDCLQCHDHDYDDVVNIGAASGNSEDAFMPSGCEGCHNDYDGDGDDKGHPGCDNVADTPDDAPNVMGDGTEAAGVAAPPNNKPYDDGQYGYNVNGHGANGFAPNTGPTFPTPDLDCTICHDLSSPQPSTHFDCQVAAVDEKLNTRVRPGWPDTRNSNTSHLVAGFLPAAGSAQARQLAFDDYCYSTCHGSIKNMRHSSKNPPGSRPPLYDGITEFGQSDTTSNPKQDRSPAPFWTPWTISDHTDAAGTGTYYGTCASCHDPHGTNTSDVSGNYNHMMLHNWRSDPVFFCTSNCHKVP